MPYQHNGELHIFKLRDNTKIIASFYDPKILEDINANRPFVTSQVLPREIGYRIENRICRTCGKHDCQLQCNCGSYRHYYCSRKCKKYHFAFSAHECVNCSEELFAKGFLLVNRDVFEFAGPICNACMEIGVKLKKCGRCKLVRYCNVEHQKSDWSEHKKSCKKLTQ